MIRNLFCSSHNVRRLPLQSHPFIIPKSSSNSASLISSHQFITQNQSFSSSSIIHNNSKVKDSSPIIIQQDKKSRFKEQSEPREKPLWEKRNESLKARYPIWNPTKKLSRSVMEDIKTLKDKIPHLKTIDLANHFQISPESIRRILRSKWVPTEQEQKSIMERHQRRKENVKSLRDAQKEELIQQQKRMKLGKSIGINDVVINNPDPLSSKSKPKPKPYNYKQNFTSDNGKVKFNSDVNHGYYNKRGRKKHNMINKPFTDSVADMLD
ncbi:hypothetical protein DFJ63DRAFT_312848 [Scheffersomyces coipomensis]|uniref:uncharacterized protein n=1 Tax=Scheffersomyces coipomensis TaxID=1788519 RepID=UPI00315C8A45